MKPILFAAALLLQHTAFGQQPVAIRFTNDYQDVYHLSLVIYTPDGKAQTRVSNLDPEQTKAYSFPVGTEIFVADWKQEAFAMKGNDIKASGVQPTLVLAGSDNGVTLPLSTVAQLRERAQVGEVKK